MTILLIANVISGLVALGSGWLEIDLLERAAVEGISDDEAEAIAGLLTWTRSFLRRRRLELEAEVRSGVEQFALRHEGTEICQGARRPRVGEAVEA